MLKGKKLKFRGVGKNFKGFKGFKKSWELLSVKIYNDLRRRIEPKFISVVKPTYL